MENDIKLVRALRGILGNIATAQDALHGIANDNITTSRELNELWIALDKAELIIRRLIQ
jgi:hypothetical protein